MIGQSSIRYRARPVSPAELSNFLPAIVKKLSIARGHMLLDQIQGLVQADRTSDLIAVVAEPETPVSVEDVSGEGASVDVGGAKKVAVGIILVVIDPTLDRDSERSSKSGTVLFGGVIAEEGEKAAISSVDWSPLARALSSELEPLLRSRDVVFVQWPSDDPQDIAEALRFRLLGTLEYMRREAIPAEMPKRISLSPVFPHSPVSSSESVAVGLRAPDADSGETWPSFVRLVEETYRQTLDSPELGHLSTAAEILAGYRRRENFSPELWFWVHAEKEAAREKLTAIADSPFDDASRPAGCLVLAKHPGSGPSGRVLETVYMGVVPGRRGEGLGKLIVQAAGAVAWEQRCQTLILAVDTGNWPAQRAYRSAGYEPVLREIVYGKRLSHDA